MIDWNENHGAIEVERVQLIDLEGSAHLPPNCAARGMQLGSMMWRSPEAHAEGPMEKHSDMFSFGIVVSSLASASVERWILTRSSV